MTRLVTDPLLRAWLALVLLSAAGTALSVSAPAQAMPAGLGLALLALAFVKARLILLGYMGLAQAPSWRGGGVAALAVAALVLGLFYLIG